VPEAPDGIATSTSTKKAFPAAPTPHAPSSCDNDAPPELMRLGAHGTMGAESSSPLE
jgi:hypothetical protein